MKEEPGAVLTAIVLAAGCSRRMGPQNKLLLDVGGEPVVARVLRAFTALPTVEIVVVAGAERERVAAVVREHRADARIVFNPDYETGMASSIRRGVQAASAHSNGFAICPGDLPLLSAAVVERLWRAFGGRPRRIVQPTCDGRRGHPVLFGRAFREALLGLSGDVGARAVLDQNERRVARVEMHEAGIFLDADTPEALAELRQAWSGGTQQARVASQSERSR